MTFSQFWGISSFVDTPPPSLLKLPALPKNKLPPLPVLPVILLPSLSLCLVF
jgi:hypothetical protein